MKLLVLLPSTVAFLVALFGALWLFTSALITGHPITSPLILTMAAALVWDVRLFLWAYIGKTFNNKGNIL